MDWNRVEGNWKEMKGKVKEQWGKLTDDDLDVIAGKQDQLEGRLQQRYGYAKIRPARKSTTGTVGRPGEERKSPARAGLFTGVRCVPSTAGDDAKVLWRNGGCG